MNLIITNIGQLVSVASNGAAVKIGREMRDIGVIENAAVIIEDGIITYAGPKDKMPLPKKDIDILDADGRVALPGFIDAHTHACFSGGREKEFAQRCEGISYQQIAEQGGGILNTVRSVQTSTRKELKKKTDHHLDSMLRLGTTTVEIKSGYGLTMEDEVKMLEAIDDVRKEHYCDVVPTFLPAHAVPPEFSGKKDDYIQLVVDKMIPYVAKRKLAGSCDVFCEREYFTIEETKKILTTAKSFGMKIKIHAEELSNTGGAELGVELGALSVDHLEHISDRGIESLAASSTVAVLLPGVSFFLNHDYASARKLIDAGAVVALATDFNPGSCMCRSMPMMMSIACTQMRMTPEEAITASTLNAAAALGMSQNYGSIEVGKKGDIILFSIPNYIYVPYHFGENHIWRMIKNGTILEFS